MISGNRMVVKMIIDQNRIFAPVVLGKTSGYAHIDTGALHSAVLESFAARFPQIGTREFRGALGKRLAVRVSLDEFSFAGVTFKGISTDVQPDATGGLHRLPFRVILSLGSDVLLQHPLHLDFNKGEIGFLAEDDVRLERGRRIPADFQFGPPLFQAALGIDTLNVVFDTGAGMSVFNQSLLPSLEVGLIKSGPLEVEDPTGAKLVIPTFQFKDLRIGGIDCRGRRFLAIDLSAIEHEAGLSIGFVLGLDFISERNWVIDRRHATIIQGKIADR
jgi:hypothetical protein